MGEKPKVFQKNKKIKPTELFVSASPNAVDKAMKASSDIDEAKLGKNREDESMKSFEKMKGIAEIIVGLASLFAILQYVYLFANPPIALSISLSGELGVDGNSSVITPVIKLENLGKEVPIRYSVGIAKITNLSAFDSYYSESPTLTINAAEINTCGFTKWYNKGALIFPGSVSEYNLHSVCLRAFPNFARYEITSNIDITYNNADYDYVMRSCDYSATYVINTGNGKGYPVNEKNICSVNIENVILNELNVIIVLIIVAIAIIAIISYSKSRKEK
jgi:hypothetical protein